MSCLLLAQTSNGVKRPCFCHSPSPAVPGSVPAAAEPRDAENRRTSVVQKRFRWRLPWLLWTRLSLRNFPFLKTCRAKQRLPLLRLPPSIISPRYNLPFSVSICYAVHLSLFTAWLLILIWVSSVLLRLGEARFGERGSVFFEFKRDIVG